MKINKLEKNIQLPSNRNFGLVFFIFFTIISIYPLINNGDIRYWTFFIAITFFILGIFDSKLLMPLNKMWMKFGLFLGKIVSPIVMGIIYFLVVTPTSLILKIFNKDVLNLKINNGSSYWIKRDTTKSRMKNQF